MKKGNRNKSLVITFFLIGQLHLMKLSLSESSYEMKNIYDLVMRSESYYLKNNMLWILREIPKNAEGIITAEHQEVNYIYEKIERAEWEHKNRIIALNGEKILMKQKMTSFSGKGDGNTKKVVSDLMSSMCGKLTYGEKY